MTFKAKMILCSLTTLLLLVAHPQNTHAKPSCNLGLLLNKALGSKIEERIGAVSEWDIPNELSETLKRYWEESPASIEEKLNHTYEKVLEARIKNLNPGSRLAVKLAGRGILNRKGWYQKTLGRLLGSITGTHYNPILNTVFLSKSGGGRLSDFVAAIHEMEHAVDRNANLLAGAGTVIHVKESLLLVPTPLGALNRFAMESKAIGAQWELMQRIPSPHRRAICDLVTREAKLKKIALEERKAEVKSWWKKRVSKSGPNPAEQEVIEDLEQKLATTEVEVDILDEILLKSLNYAWMPKQDFISVMRDYHGYTLENILRTHYGVNAARVLLTVSSGFGVYHGVKGYVQENPGEIKKGIDGIGFADLRFYLHLIAASALDAKSAPPQDTTKVLEALEQDLK